MRSLLYAIVTPDYDSPYRDFTVDNSYDTCDSAVANCPFWYAVIAYHNDDTIPWRYIECEMAWFPHRETWETSALYTMRQHGIASYENFISSPIYRKWCENRPNIDNLNGYKQWKQEVFTALDNTDSLPLHITAFFDTINHT